MEKNIFEAASNEFNKSSKNPQQKNPKPQAKIPTSEFGSGDPEMQTMLEQMREMRLHLKNQLLDMYDLGRKNNVDIDKLLQIQSNLTPREIQLMSQQSEQFEKNLKGLTKTNTETVKKTTRSKEELEKERKAKTLGARKKNWISVR